MFPLAACLPKSVRALSWLFRDLFTTEVAAGALNATAATPGPGNRASTDASSLMAIKPWIGGASVQDETGASFGPENNLCSYYPGQAWVGFNGLDLGAAPLTADTWYLCRMLDSTGKMAVCFVKGGDIGPGETLGAELVTNGDFSAWTGDDPDGWTVAGQDANNYFTESVGGGQCRMVTAAGSGLSMQQTPILAEKKLCKFSGSIVTAVTGQIIFGPANTVIYQESSAGEKTSYRVQTGIIRARVGNKINPADFTLDNFSIKEVTAPPATCLYAYVSPGGAQGWLMDPSFNMNDTAYTFDFYPLGDEQLVCVGGKATASQGDPGVWEPAHARALGKTFIFGPFNINDVTKILEIGLDENQSGAIVGSALRITGDTIVPVDAGTGGSNIYTPADATAYYFAIRLLAAGAEYYIRTATGPWIKLWRGGTDATASLYPGVSNNTAAFTLDDILVANWNPSVLAFDSFTRADGAVGSTEATDADGLPAPVKAWSAEALTLSANNLPIAPELGAELVTNGAFDDATGWTLDAGWSVSGGTLNSTSGGGSSNATFNTGSAFSVNTWYRLALNLVSVTASYPRFGLGGFVYVNISASPTGVRTAVSRGASDGANLIANNVSGNFAGSLDDLSLKPITFSTTLSLHNTVSSDVTISVTPTLTAGTQCGLGMSFDSVASPANGVIAYHDGTYAYLEKIVGGVWNVTPLIKQAVAYGAGKKLKVVKSGTQYSLYYDDVQMGSTVTISDAGIISNVLHGGFSTYEGNDVGTLEITPYYSGRISSNALVITPSFGEELVVNGDMETGDPPSSWNPNRATLSADEDANTGDQSLRITATQNNTAEAVQGNSIGTGSWIFVECYAKKVDANVLLRLLSGLFGLLSASQNYTSDSWGRIVATARNTDNTTYIYARAVSDTIGQYSLVDDISVKQISLPSTLSLLDLGTADVILRPNASAFTAGTQLGVAIAVDSASNPQNGIFAYVDGTYVYLDVLIAGVWTNKIKSTTAYVAGKLPHIYRDGTYIAMYYNDALLGSAITLSGAENTALRGTLHGAFSTYEGNGVADIGFSARGTGGEFNSLNRYLR